jgi:hypothetical protein
VIWVFVYKPGLRVGLLIKGREFLEKLLLLQCRYREANCMTSLFHWAEAQRAVSLNM